MNMTKQGKRGRGRGSGAGRGGRGRSRGRGTSALSKIIEVVDVEEDDDLCNMALERFELDNNSLTRSFEELNTAIDLEGFDPMSGNLWIYPTNRPIRDYQFQIVKTALFNNTLVSLPTGLGKTFIAAVVMYNFQRWYPQGIVVFMAPTRPLVTQQLDACHNTVGISPSKTSELTGTIPPKKREQLWKSKTVFFLTPQVMMSDLERNYFPAERVRCVIVDEAHKALGNHAYVQVISKLSERNKLFRVLALSATPGSDLLAVQQVFKNLLISRVELRSEKSPDILPYIHDKRVEKIIVHMDDYLKSVYNRMTEIFQNYSGKLMKANALSGRDGTSYSKFQILKARETFRSGLAQKIPSYQKGFIEVDFAICISLAHSIEILLSHGLRTYYSFLHGVISKEKGTSASTSELRKNMALVDILDEVQQKLNISVENSIFDFSNTSALFSVVGSPKLNTSNKSFNTDDVDYSLSHPKLKHLKEIVKKHFIDHKNRSETTRVMIFSQYRDSVQEIGNMLNSLRPMVKPMVFIGQANTGTVGRGLKQKDQVQVVQQFRDGGFNVLVSTSVGEEGLDIGEVDLIICFDASKSPTRLVQRMGRTGRKRDGRTVFLLTVGKEERSYNASCSLHNSISKSITDPKKLEPFLYKHSPRMIPAGAEPTCYKMTILLSTEQTDKSSTMDMDLPDDDESESKDDTIKDFIEPKKPIGNKKKGKKVAASSVADNSIAIKRPNNTISSLFKKISEAKSGSEPPSCANSTNRTVTERRSVPLVVTLDDEEPAFTNNDIPRSSVITKSCEKTNLFVSEKDSNVEYYQPFDFDMDDGVHEIPVNQFDTLSKFSIYPLIFDVDKLARKEWKPCASYAKTENPASDVVTKMCAHLDIGKLILDEQTLSAVENQIKSRLSFSCEYDEFCPCGNTMEEHEVCANNNAYIETPVNSGAKNNPKESNVMASKSTTSIPIVPWSHKTLNEYKESGSESDDCRSEFSVSPEVPQSCFLERLKELKTIKDSGQKLFPEKTFNTSRDQRTTQSPVCSYDSSQTQSQGVSKKKFKFKKKGDNAIKSQDSDDDIIVTHVKQLKSSVAHPKKDGAIKSPDLDDEIFVTHVKQLESSVPHRRMDDAIQSPDLDDEIFVTHVKQLESSVPHRRMDDVMKSPDLDDEIFVTHIKQLESSVVRQNAPVISAPKFSPIPKNSTINGSVFKTPQPPRSSHFIRSFHSPASSANEAPSNTSIQSPVFNESPRSSRRFSITSNEFPLNESHPTTLQSPFVEEFAKSANQPVTSTVTSGHRHIFKAFNSRTPSVNEAQPSNNWSDSQFLSSSFVESPPRTKRFIVPDRSIPIHDSQLTTLQSHFVEEVATPTPTSGYIFKAVNSTRTSSFSEALPTRNWSNSSFRASPSPFIESPRSSSRSCLVPNRSLSLNDSRLSTFQSPFVEEVTRRRRRNAGANPFISDEADVSGGESDESFADENEFEGLDDFDDSFVTHDESYRISDSQQVRYMESVKEAIPVRFGRIEKPLSPKNYGTAMDTTGDSYDEEDSFCAQDDEVDYMDVGVFTQAMNQAKVELATNASTHGRQTRRGKQVAKTRVKPAISQGKPRKRIIALEDSSDDDFN